MLPYLLNQNAVFAYLRKGRQEVHHLPAPACKGPIVGMLHVRRRLSLLPGREETLEIKKRVWEVGTCMYVARWEAGEGGRLGYVNGWSGVSVSSSFFSLVAGVCV